MYEEFQRYIVSLTQSIPICVYQGLLAILCIGMVALIAIKGIRTCWKQISILILIEYVFVIFCSTVLFREYAASSGHNFSIFWSYKAILEGESYYIAENIMNVVTFIPVGLLLPCAFRHIKWWQIALIGLEVSLSIETLQYLLHRGFSELDDVIHNTLGCMIGGGFVLSHRKHR